ncbi:MAG: filamentous hemagglutinin N-terminal domain-containing protein, partial [Burkholderiaceae bacterium]|nr:filamentous hemagglutinin N-terminal domain-containing protein [Burkholderiaceae bacterium]
MNLHPVHHGLRRKVLVVLIAACYTSASANPTAPQVIAGQASFQQSGNLFSITNSPNAIINWQSFSIAPNEITRFIQQNADSRVLNRITGQDPSRILGALQSNGHVYLINPNGVLFGRDARVDVQGLVASSLALSDTDFLAGRQRFSGVGAGKVSNEGVIVTPGGGRVFLVGASVDNSGVITSPQGEVVLAAGHTVQLVDSSDPSVHVVVSAPDGQALNLGQVLAAGGRVGIYGALVNQRGKVSADSAVRGENGKIVLKASGTTLLEKGSITSAVNSAGQGGDIRLLGQRVGLMDDAQVDASGQSGGGQILIGGGYQGQDASVPNAQQTYIGAQVQVRSNALDNGNGGRIIAWGDNATRVYGSLFARGGAHGGDGGLIETSGHYLDMQGHADTRAPFGKTGQLLLDPTNITIISGSPSGGSNVQVTGNVFAETGSSTDSDLDTGRLISALSSNNITVSTASSAAAAGNLTVTGAIAWSSANSLTLLAQNNIAINNTISNANAPLVLSATNGSITQSSAITAASLTASAPAGSITLNHASNAISGAVTASAASNISLAAQTLTTGAVSASGSGIIQATSSSGALTIAGNMSTNGGAITLESNYLNGIATGSSTVISSAGGLVILRGDNMDLQGTINAGAGGITTIARSTSQAVHLGGTEADSTNILALTEAEIQRFNTTGSITLTNHGVTGSPDIEVGALNVASSHPSGTLNIVAQGDADINVLGNLTTNGVLVVTSGDTATSRITLDGALTSANSVVLSTGFLSANQNITAPTIGLVSKNSIDVGAVNETAGVLNIPTAKLSRFNTSSLLLQVDDSISSGDITFSQPFSWTGSL